MKQETQFFFTKQGPLFLFDPSPSLTPARKSPPVMTLPSFPEPKRFSGPIGDAPSPAAAGVPFSVPLGSNLVRSLAMTRPGSEP